MATDDEEEDDDDDEEVNDAVGKGGSNECGLNDGAVCNSSERRATVVL
jgi:hypothetical protein